jgi:hypothetical protein
MKVRAGVLVHGSDCLESAVRKLAISRGLLIACKHFNPANLGAYFYDIRIMLRYMVGNPRLQATSLSFHAPLLRYV